jgi:hypothetical protein
MEKKVKVEADKAKQINEKLKKYSKLHEVFKNVNGGIGVSFPRLSGIRQEDPL